MADSGTRPAFMTVKELAALLRVTERKVYDLASSGQVPCTKATGKLLFPEDDVRAWMDAARTGPSGQRLIGVPRPPVILGSHDPLLDWAIRHSGSGLATIFDASLEGLRRFQSGEGIAAGLHIRERDGRWNLTTVQGAFDKDNVVLVRWVERSRGLIFKKDTGRTVREVSDIADLRVAVRQAEAGSEVLFRQILTEAGLSSDRIKAVGPYRSEQEAILAVLQGEADVTLGLQSLAHPFGLGFLPVVDEAYDVLVDRKSWFEPPLQALFGFTESRAFREKAASLTGVDIGTSGRVVWNA